MADFGSERMAGFRMEWVAEFALKMMADIRLEIVAGFIGIRRNAKMLKKREDAQQKMLSAFGEIEHLREDSDVVEVEI